MNGRQFYTSLFGISDSDLDKVIAVASEVADYADLYFEHTSCRELTLRDGAVGSGGFHIDYGVGIRVLKGERTGYSYCETTCLQDMLEAARIAASIAECANVSGSVKIRKGNGSGNVPGFYPDGDGWDSVEGRSLSDYLKRIEQRLYASDRRITKVIARISSSISHILMYNSCREMACDSRPMGSIAVSIIFSNGKVSDSRSASRSFRKGPEFLDEELINKIVHDLCNGIDSCLEARRPKGGRMPVVMGAGASGILLHEAMGHAFEADFNRKGQSVFCDRMGRQVCSKEISIVDDGTFFGNRGACNYDDEGIMGQKTYMVQGGKLTSYLHDRISAAHYGVSPTGNGRRESFRFNPIPRMRLTYMENGETDPSDIVASVRNGIYVDEFSNGQVKIGEGDFTFYVKSGFLIENGRFTAPVKDINIIGNGPDALADISMVGNDLKIDDSSWTCGKDQNVPVGCGMPTVLVNELTVGGE